MCSTILNACLLPFLDSVICSIRWSIRIVCPLKAASLQSSHMHALQDILTVSTLVCLRRRGQVLCAVPDVYLKACISLTHLVGCACRYIQLFSGFGVRPVLDRLLVLGRRSSTRPDHALLLQAPGARQSHKPQRAPPPFRSL